MRSFLLKLLLTIITFYLALSQVELSEIKKAFTEQQPIYVIACLCAISLQSIAGGLRWHHIRAALETEPQNPTHTTLIYFASSIFNVIMPSTIGSDVARTLLAKQSGAKAGEVIYGVLIDRLMSLVGLALLVASTLPLLFAYLDWNPNWGFAAAILCWVMAIGGYVMLRFVIHLLGAFTHIRFIGSIINAVSKIIGKHVHVIAAAAWCIMAHMCYATAAYALGQGLGLDLSWVACVVLVPLVLFISTLPISIGGWGIRELGMASILALASISSAPAIVLSIQLGLMTTVISLGGGLAYLLLKK